MVIMPVCCMSVEGLLRALNLQLEESSSSGISGGFFLLHWGILIQCRKQKGVISSFNCCPPVGCLDSTCFAGSPAPSANDIPLSWYCRLLSTGRRPLLEGPSSEDIASVWSPPHTHSLPHHGLYLCLPVFPLRPILWECLVGCPRVHPTLSGTNGEDDKIQDFPGLSALLPPDLQLHSLQSPLGQS